MDGPIGSSSLLDGFDARVETPTREAAIPLRPISALRRFLAFVGPGYLVATGYMDPGNWATSLAAGAKFGTELLFVAVLSSLMAIVLQSLSARLAIATQSDLATLCRTHCSRPVSIGLWLVSEIAILATDLAEVIGTAIGLQMLFGLPLIYGALLTACDTFLILAFERFGFRKIETFVIVLLVIIASAFAVQLFMASPDAGEVLTGLVPTAHALSDPAALYLAIGILGATVMPHNLFLHSGVIGTRAAETARWGKRDALRFATLDSAIALVFALVINAAILILAAATFHRAGLTDIVDLGQAYKLIAPILGSALAAKCFAIALIACGLNSTLTATMAGQIVMNGFLDLRLRPALRRIVTRTIAIVPAIVTILIMGEAATGRLLIASQVVLSLALPFAVVPLVFFNASGRIMGELRASLAMRAGAFVIGAAIIALNAKLLVDIASE